MSTRAFVTGLVWVAAALTVSAQVSDAQVSDTVRQRYEAGQYDEALRAVNAAQGVNPANNYVAAQILIKQDLRDQALEQLDRMVQGQDQVWTLVGQSARALVERDNDRALQSATKAVAAGPDRFFAHYQIGLVQAGRNDWEAAAASFARAAEIDPTFAYAHYYAGSSYSRIKRVDQTAAHFEMFLKLAPRAPERPAVESIMRTLRGR